MPDMKLVVPAVIGIAVLVTIASLLGWLVSHPPILILVIAGVAGTVFLFVRRRRARTRV